MNTDNMKTLAAYLWNLPRDYVHFDMGTYASSTENYRPMNVGQTAKLNDMCGAVACAIGHAPAAIPESVTLYDETWGSCEQRVFDTDYSEYDWCFDDEWRLVDNTPHGAAQRIWYMLEHGVPELFRAQMMRDGQASLCYTHMTPPSADLKTQGEE